MRWTSLIIILLFSLILQDYTIYAAEKPKEIVYEPIYKSAVALSEFSDERPTEEHKGLKDRELMVFGTTDKNFHQPVNQFIAQKLKEELKKAGVKVVLDGEAKNADYCLSGRILHFQAIAKMPKSSIIPYLGAVASVWNKDQFTVNINIQAQLVRAKDNAVIFDKVFTVAEDQALRTGLLNLGRFTRGFDYQRKLLDLALENVLKQIRSEIINVLKEVKP